MLSRLSLGRYVCEEYVATTEHEANEICVLDTAADWHIHCLYFRHRIRSILLQLAWLALF